LLFVYRNEEERKDNEVIKEFIELSEKHLHEFMNITHIKMGDID
jgi:hypothetical protein